MPADVNSRCKASMIRDLQTYTGQPLKSFYMISQYFTATVSVRCRLLTRASSYRPQLHHDHWQVPNMFVQVWLTYTGTPKHVSASVYPGPECSVLEKPGSGSSLHAFQHAVVGYMKRKRADPADDLLCLFASFSRLGIIDLLFDIIELEIGQLGKLAMTSLVHGSFQR